MKLIYDPKVYLVMRPQINAGELQTFLDDHGVGDWQTDTESDGDAAPEIAGRVCYLSFGKPRPGGNKVYLDHIKASGHGSVLEHPSWSFIVTGVSRSFTHELVRHRAGFAYSQLSQRYVDESVAEYVVPHDLKNEVKDAYGFLELHNRTATDLCEAIKADPQPWSGVTEYQFQGLSWIRSMERLTEEYRKKVNYLSRKLVEDQRRAAGDLHPLLSNEDWLKCRPQDERTAIRKAARGAARSVLPNATETKVFVSANARAWRHLIEMRGAAPAEVEARKVSHLVWQRLVKEAPNVFGDYDWSVGDVPLDVRTPTKKV